MKKIIMFLFMGILVLLPLNVNAAETDLYKLISNDRTLKITSISSLPPKYLNGDPNMDVAYDIEFSALISSYINNMDSIVNYRKNVDPTLDVSVFCVSDKDCGILLSDSNTKFDMTEEEMAKAEYPNPYMVHFDVEINVNEKVNNTVYQNIKKNFPVLNDNDPYNTFDSFYLMDMAYINQFFSYANGKESFLSFSSKSSYDGDAENALLVFPKLKESYENYSGIKFEYGDGTGMGGYLENLNFDDVYSVKSGQFITYYNNVAYMVNSLGFFITPVVFVSDDIADTNEAKIEAATKRIKDYINDSSVNVLITDKNSNYNSSKHTAINDSLVKLIKEYLNETVSVTGNSVYELKIGSKTTRLFIVRVDNDLISTQEVKSKDLGTGIEILTASAQVPLDARVKVVDVTNQMNDSNILKAYDINLYSSLGDTYIKNIPGGVKVMIPVEDDFDSQGKKVYYLNDNEETVGIPFEVEEINTKKYVTFVTNHFSVYGIGNDTQNIKISPVTGDGIYIVLLTLFVSSMCVIIIQKELKQKVN